MAAPFYEDDLSLLPPANLAGEIERLREDLFSERERNLRTLADFANYRRRIERDGNRLAEEGKREMILRLLDIVDDLEKALRWAANEKTPLAAGVRLIHHNILALLETHGVLPFESLGTPFDPHRHEAVALATDSGNAAGTVVDELRRGYLWKTTLLRAAQVRVVGS